uniref:Flotillin-like n=1 Tax=Chenopodium quinoa TaxID=63459 RepID=A0A803LE50_CHEQI
MIIPLFKIARPSEYLAITIWNIQDIKLAKKALILPGQRYVRVNVSPVNYTFNVQAISSEKLPFVLPAAFTIGPRINSDDHHSLVLYAKLMAPHNMNSDHVHELVQGIIEGETRLLAAAMTMEEVFKGTEFKKEVFQKVQMELNQFGLFIYNANIKQLVGVPGHEYFSYLGQKIQMEAVIRSKKEADVAKANAELAALKAGRSKSVQLAEVEAEQAVSLRGAKLQVKVGKKNALTRTEKLRLTSSVKPLLSVTSRVKKQINTYTTTKERQMQFSTGSKSKLRQKRHQQMLPSTLASKELMQTSMARRKRLGESRPLLKPKDTPQYPAQGPGRTKATPMLGTRHHGGTMGLECGFNWRDRAAAHGSIQGSSGALDQ